MDERARHHEFASRFTSQLAARARALVRGVLPADRVQVASMPDGDDAVRAALSRLQVFDRDVLDQMPGRDAVQLTFSRPVLGGLFRRTMARVRALTLVPVDELVEGRTPGPAGREDVLDALARYELLPKGQRPTAVVLASATGFTPEARGLVRSAGGPTLVLMGGRDDGGWDVELPPTVAARPWARLFELETGDARLRRLRAHLEELSGELDSQGVPVPALAERLGMSARETERLVRETCRHDPRLMTVVHAGTVHLCRTPLAESSMKMSIWKRILRLLGRKPTTADRVRELTAQRVALEQQRLDVDKQVDRLETQERELLQQGAQAPSDAEKRQVAGKLVRLRRDLKRQRTRAQVFSQQIDILGTQIHHLTLNEQGKQVPLPTAEELTQQAAEAEQMLGELGVNAELAASIEVGASTPAMEEEEASIMAEFAQVAERHAPSAAEQADQTEAAPSAEESPPQRTPTPPLPSATRQREDKAGPEVG